MQLSKNGVPVGDAYGLDLREGDGITLTVADERQTTGAMAVTVGNGGSQTSLVNAKTQYGAKGDGSTDDTTALQNAITAAAATAIDSFGVIVGAAVFVPEGRYKTTSALTWATNVSLYGVGVGKTIFKPTGANTHFIQKGGAIGSEITDCTFRDFEIDGSAVTGTSGKGIFITYMKRPRFQNLYVHDTLTTGLGCDFLLDAIFDGCVVEGCGRAASGAPTSTAGCSGIGIGCGAYAVESIQISNCVARNNFRYGIFVEYQGGLSTLFSVGTKIVNNHVEGNQWGIGSAGVRRDLIAGNTVKGNTSDGILVGADVGYTFGALSCQTKIVDNIVTDNGGRGISIDGSNVGVASAPVSGGFVVRGNEVASNTGVGIKMQAASQFLDCEIFDNDVLANGSIGIDVVGGGGYKNSIFDMNRVRNNTGVGIRMLTNLSGGRIANNASTNTSGTAQTYGLELSAAFTQTDLVVRDNSLAGNATGALNQASTLAGTTRIVRNQGYNPIGASSVTVTGSPMTYTAGATFEDLYIIGGTITSVTVGGVTLLTSPGLVPLDPNQAAVITYSASPTAIKTNKR